MYFSSDEATSPLTLAARSEEGEPPGLGQRQEPEHRQHRDHQHRRAAERGDVAHRFLEPGRADRVGGIARHPEGEDDGFVDGAGFAFQHFVRQLDEGPGRAGDEDDGDEDARNLERNLERQQTHVGAHRDSTKVGSHHPLCLDNLQHACG